MSLRCYLCSDDSDILHGPYSSNAMRGKSNGTNGVVTPYHEHTKNGQMHPQREPIFSESFEEPPLHIAILTYLSYAVLCIVGQIRDLLRYYGLEKLHTCVEQKIPGFVPLYQGWESFFSRNLYRRVTYCFNRPICTVAGVKFDVLDRVSPDYGWNFRFTGTKTHAMNFASYNYLGFAETSGPCTDAVEDVISSHGVGLCASRQELGYTDLQRELDDLTARYLDVEAAITFPMGFSTNQTNMPCIMGKGCLCLSDELNHASLILGARLSGATIVVFKHNDMCDLESKLRSAILNSHPVSHRPWKKIVIVVEGVYSMEGSIIRLPEVIALKKKYGVYLYVDEAHSIGAIGPSGRGVLDHFNLDPRDVDILMGTFTKSFGSIGGYIAGSKKLINYLRVNSCNSIYSCAMSAPVAQQIISSMRIIMGEDGTHQGLCRITQLRWNISYFRHHLQKMGFIIYGNEHSPVVPLLIHVPSKAVSFSLETLKRGLGVVVVGFPATPIIACRARFCVSAAHTKEMLDEALDIIDEVGDIIRLKYSKRSITALPVIYGNEDVDR